MATHGQVNVPYAPLKQLYEWAPLGTTVIIEDGGSPWTCGRSGFPLRFGGRGLPFQGWAYGYGTGSLIAR